MSTMTDAEIIRSDQAPQIERRPSVHIRTMATGDKIMVCEIFLLRDAHIPEHSHAEEQCGYVVSGNITFTVAGQASTLRAGDSYAIPGDMPHEAFAHEDTILVEVFSPPREDFRTR
jgi:quercetin dioxygenase-like cupin family protein